MRVVEAGEMFGFKIVDIFPDTCTDEEWMEFADNMAKILEIKDNKKAVSD